MSPGVGRAWRKKAWVLNLFWSAWTGPATHFPGNPAQCHTSSLQKDVYLSCAYIVYEWQILCIIYSNVNNFAYICTYNILCILYQFVNNYTYIFILCIHLHYICKCTLIYIRRCVYMNIWLCRVYMPWKHMYA